MAEASKLFDKSGGAASGNKQDAVNGAAMTVMKLLVQSKFSGSTTGGKDSGGLSGLVGLVSAFRHLHKSGPVIDVEQGLEVPLSYIAVFVRCIHVLNAVVGRCYLM